MPPPFNGAAALGIWFVPLAILVLVGSSNAVNLTDGLDGLAGGCMLFATAAMTLVVYAAGHAQWAAYLNVPHVPGCGELTVLAAATIGAVVGFLWFNCHPAQVFMGDTGSLPLGGLLGYMAVVARQELLLMLIGGVFVAEAASVILQVGWYKWRRRRIFLCAPLHHHFQFRGWPESKIVVRFWIAAASPRPVRRRRASESMSSHYEKHAAHCIRRRRHRRTSFPGLAVAQKLAADRPGVQITFAGTGKPLEAELVDAAGFDYLPLSSRPLPRKASEAFSFVVENMAGYFAAGRFLDDECVAGVVGLGGYASVPLGRASARRRLPLVLLDAKCRTWQGQPLAVALCETALHEL